MIQSHGERKHAKFSASGAERWANCSGSVALSEGIPPKSNVYSIEGTLAHEVLEATMTMRPHPPGTTSEMAMHAAHAARFMGDLYPQTKNTELLIEKKVSLGFIHPEAFGTLDYAIVEHFGTLQILDFKYGKALVSPVENLQFLFYALAVAHQYDFNFSRVKMWTLQPRVAGFNGYSFWEITIQELKAYIKTFQDAIKRVEENPDVFVEGPWCYFCVAKSKCPIKQQEKAEKAIAFFQPIQKTKGNKHHGKKDD